jgi:anti-anti-sigma factor
VNGAIEKIVILNLGRVEYLSSSGLHVLVSLARDLKKSNRDLRLCHLPEAVMRVLELMEITGMFAIYDDERDAVDGKEST